MTCAIKKTAQCYLTHPNHSAWTRVPSHTHTPTPEVQVIYGVHHIQWKLKYMNAFCLPRRARINLLAGCSNMSQAAWSLTVDTGTRLEDILLPSLPILVLHRHLLLKNTAVTTGTLFYLNSFSSCEVLTNGLKVHTTLTTGLSCAIKACSVVLHKETLKNILLSETQFSTMEALHENHVFSILIKSQDMKITCENTHL